MSTFRVHNFESAPQESRATMEQLKKNWGFLPNLVGVLAESPAALDDIAAAYGALMGKGTLTPAEQQIVCIAASRENSCEYCVAAHSTMALGAKVDAGEVESLRSGQPLQNAKHETLRTTTAKLIQKRGMLSEQDQKRFFDEGYTPGQLLEVIGWISAKVLSNYTNNVARTPLDPQFSSQEWKFG